MRKQEKIRLYMSKGLTEEEAQQLITYNCEDVLTLDQLRIKFNDENLGKGYPDWVTPTEHLKMCYKTVKDEYKHSEYDIDTPEDLAIQLYISSYIRINKFNSLQSLKTGLINMCKNSRRKSAVRYKYWGCSLDCPVHIDSKNTDVEESHLDNIRSNSEMEDSEREVANCIRNIKHKQIRQVLIITGYLLANIGDLYKDYIEVLDSCDITTQNKLLDLAQNVYDKEQKNYIQKPVNNTKISFTNILEAFGKDYFGEYKDIKQLKNDIQSYLVDITKLISPCKKVVQTISTNTTIRERVYKERCIN